MLASHSPLPVTRFLRSRQIQKCLTGRLPDTAVRVVEALKQRLGNLRGGRTDLAERPCCRSAHARRLGIEHRQQLWRRLGGAGPDARQCFNEMHLLGAASASQGLAQRGDSRLRLTAETMKR